MNEMEHAAVIGDQSEKRLRAVARLVRGYVFEASFSAKRSIEFTWADEHFRDLFDCERDEVNLRGWMSFVDPRDLLNAARRLTHVAMGISTSMEIRITSLKGKLRWLRVAIEPVRDTSMGRISGMMGVVEDITERKRLTEQMFESVNREQQRIGTDLHDELGQVLTGATLLLRGCLTTVQRGLQVQAKDLEDTLSVISGAVGTTRTLAHGLAPGALGRGDFTVALTHLVSQTRRWSGMNIAFTAPSKLSRALSPVVTDHLYRIVQEALTNATRHSKANNLSIFFKIDDDKLELEVIDDGVGIASPPTAGFGLKTMQYRAESIGARLKVGRAYPNGTRVIITLSSWLLGNH